MRADAASGRPVLLVLSSTYPRWSGDHEPGFVHELARRLTTTFDVVAVVPRAPGASDREMLDGVTVIRYGYAPRRFETLVNDGGIVTNLKRHRAGNGCSSRRSASGSGVHCAPHDCARTAALAPCTRTGSFRKALLRQRSRDRVQTHAAVRRDIARRRSARFARQAVAECCASGLSARAAALTVVSEAMRTALQARTGASTRGITVAADGHRSCASASRRIRRRRAMRTRSSFVGRLVEARRPAPC